MDPQVAFACWHSMILEGEYETASDYQTSYNEWIKKGGYCALDNDNAVVVKLDLEQDRYLVFVDGDMEQWRKVTE